MSTHRVPLPWRRRQITETVTWDGRTWALSVGLTDDGAVGEVFMRGPRTGSAMDALVDDGCILASMLLQSGYRAQDIADRLSREGVVPGAPAASVLAFVADCVAALERDLVSSSRPSHCPAVAGAPDDGGTPFSEAR